MPTTPGSGISALASLFKPLGTTRAGSLIDQATAASRTTVQNARNSLTDLLNFTLTRADPINILNIKAPENVFTVARI